MSQLEPGPQKAAFDSIASVVRSANRLHRFVELGATKIIVERELSVLTRRMRMLTETFDIVYDGIDLEQFNEEEE